MTTIVCFAYSIQKTQIVNAPQWFDEQPWDIEGVPDTAGMPNCISIGRCCRSCFPRGFGLVTHHDKRELSGYAITIAKGGRKLEKSKSDPDALSDQSGIGPAKYMKFTNDSMTDFAQFMQLMGDRPVVDQTNLSGRYDFTLLWTPDVMRDTPTETASGLFTAVQEAAGVEAGGHSCTDRCVCRRCRKAADAKLAGRGALPPCLLAVFAEFEREILRERVRACLAQARQNGKRLGRPPSVVHQTFEV
jgi:uncharacterized protein (TIGR03435 family)